MKEENLVKSRREVLISGGVVGAGIVAADFSILKAFAGPLPPLRKSLAGMAWNDRRVGRQVGLPHVDDGDAR